MTGISQQTVWGRVDTDPSGRVGSRGHRPADTDPSHGDESAAREHVIVENRHQPTTLHLKTFINQRYKITLYFNREYGEIYDLLNDPG